MKSYGYGLDIHSCFIAVCVHVRNNNRVFKYLADFNTDWNSLLAAKQWVIVTYTVQDVNGRRYFVDEYTPEQYCEIGEAVELPVYVKTFKKNSGDIGYSFCVQQQFGPARGEHF